MLSAKPPPPKAAEQDHLTDLGNAHRLIEHHGHDLHYCDEWGKWLVWNKTRWANDDMHEAVRRAKATVRALHDEAVNIEDDEKRRVFIRRTIASEAAPRIRGIVELAKTEAGVPVATGQLDSDRWVLNVRNGTLDLRTGQLRLHRREDLITKLAPVAYDERAACPTWVAFLRRILAEDEALIRFVQKAVGYSLTGSVQEQCLFILYGTGANGKSTFLNTISTILGEYARHTPTETLLINRSEGVRNDLARLQGTRFVTAIEAEGGRRLAEAQVKQLTGGDRVTARYLYREHFEFVPAFKLWLAVNHKPMIQGTDPAIWRRIHLIPFTVTIPTAERDKQLTEKLQAELPGILRWTLEGCQAWQQEELEPPEAVRRATGDYRAEMDVIAKFIGECCVTGAEKRVSKGELYTEYVGWCAQMGEAPVGQKAFTTALQEQGFSDGRSNSERFWKELALKVEVAEMAEPLAS